MAGIFTDGFDGYSGTGASVGLATKWTLVGGGALGTGRFGGQALRLTQTATARGAQAAMASATSALMLNVGFKIDLHPTTGYGQIQFLSGTTYMVGIGVNTDGSITAYRQTATNAGTALGTSAAGLVTLGVWYSLEATLTISDTVGAVTIKLDGATVLTLTNVDTRNGTPTTVNTIRFYASSGGSYDLTYDDIYVTDSASFLANAVRIETLVPNGDGATLNWTPSTGTSHFAVVDELPVSATDYLQASTVGNIDELDLTALSSTPTDIQEVVVVGYASKTDAAARSIYLGVGSGGTNSQGPSFALNSSGARHERRISTDPNTGLAWNASAVNALKVRPEVAS